MAARRKRSHLAVFLVLLVLGAGGTGAWWLFFRDPLASPVGGDPGEPDLTEIYNLLEDQRPLMGTVFRIALYTTDEAPAREAIAAAFARGEEINAACSDYDPDSELSRLNAHRGPGPLPVSPTLATVLAHARTTADATSGLYDPTLGTLTTLWREARDSGELPAPAALARAREATGWQHLEVDLEENTARITKPGVHLDLGGIAKGYAADEMLSVLRRAGFPRALIAAGGDIRLGTPPPGASAWRVGLRTLSPDVPEFINAANCAVSTSGDLHQFVVIGNQRFSHIIDPRTGLGLGNRIAATVVAPTAIQSDPLATFCCIAPDQALEAFLGGEIACRIVSLDADGAADRRSPHFPEVQAR